MRTFVVDIGLYTRRVVQAKVIRPLRRLLTRNDVPRIVIMIGASGAGKTTIARHCAELRADLPVFHLDRFKVPEGYSRPDDHPTMIKWQRSQAKVWLRWLRQHPAELVLFEGQLLVPHLIEALDSNDFPDVTVVLIDCDDTARSVRLTGRGHPHLISRTLLDRAKEYRNFARTTGALVIDSNSQAAEISARQVLALCRVTLLHRSQRKMAWQWRSAGIAYSRAASDVLMIVPFLSPAI